jgi:hypothetical protein
LVLPRDRGRAFEIKAVLPGVVRGRRLAATRRLNGQHEAGTMIRDGSQAVMSSPGRRLGRLDPLGAAVVQAIAYADVYGWPLATDEIHRFLPVSASFGDVASTLRSTQVSKLVAGVDGHHVLRGREHLVAERRRRTAASERRWPEVIRHGRLIARIPWVRMVAVSGSMAVRAARAGDDVDLFIVTDEGRLWLSRALTIAIGKVSSRRGSTTPSTLCPNYLVTASSIELEERDLYTAHELVQLVPLFGPDIYAALLDRNQWYRTFLPNHPGFTGLIPARRDRLALPWLRPVLHGGLVSRLERWEMGRKIARLQGAGPAAETRFDGSMCKGHFDGHRQRFWAAFDARLGRLEAYAE